MAKFSVNKISEYMVEFQYSLGLSDESPVWLMRESSTDELDSYLFTSLAENRAWLDSKGVLNHTLNNKDSIPTKYIIERLEIIRIDTLYIHKTDTIYVQATYFVGRDSPT